MTPPSKFENERPIRQNLSDSSTAADETPTLHFSSKYSSFKIKCVLVTVAAIDDLVILYRHMILVVNNAINKK